MTLNYLIIIGILSVLSLSLESEEPIVFKTYGTLEKYSSVLIISSHYYNPEVLYLDLDEFKDINELLFEAIAHHGHFIEDRMYYGGDSSILSNVSLFLYEKRFSEKAGEYDGGGDYFKYTYYFKIPKPNGFKYLYISTPKFDASKIEIKNISSLPSDGNSIGVILGIVIGSVVLLGIIVIVIFFVVRNKKKKNIEPPPPIYSPSVANDNPTTKDLSN